APNNAILVVAGDVDPAKVRELAETYYGPLMPSDGIATRVRPAEPPQLAERRLKFTDPNIAQPYVVRYYLAPVREPGDQKEAAALTFLAALLGGNGQTSLLSQKLAFEQRIAIAAGAGYDSTSYDPSSFSLYVVPAPGVSLADAEAAMDRVVMDFLQTGPDLQQFERLKTQVRAGEIYRRDRVGELANAYGEGLTAGLSVEDVETWPAVLQSVTPEDVQAAAQRLFDKRHSVTGWAMRSAGDEVVQ
ncbi:MAG: insulinase family protein, partial [Paracoccaceae bacterium]